jgi:outer membrane receptor protein involved in Fe transport
LKRVPILYYNFMKLFKASFKMSKYSKITLLLASLFSVTAYAADLTTSKIEVISQTPLPSLGISLDKYSSTVQSVKASDLKKSQALDISSYMNENLAGVHINEAQNNPLQPDLNYRGFTASPLLGTPQGLSVYVDGVRMNQPFGDVVSWDLIPKNAISSMQLHAGSNPLFGLNTLGGALSINTKDGRSNPGGVLQFTAGSWGRKIGEFEYGAVSEDNSKDFFIAGTWFDENGWRDKSPSDNKQLFTKFGWRNDTTSLKLSYSVADSDLNGNGATPLSMLKKRWESVYTHPDNTQNKSHLLNLGWEHFFNKDVAFTGNVYYRNIKTKTYNGDVNEGAFADIANANLTNTTGEINGNSNSAGFISGQYSAANNLAYCIANNIERGEATEKCNAIINRTTAKQESVGISGQISVNNTLFNRPNTYLVGGGYDFSKSHFIQSAEYASLIPGGGVAGSNYFATEYRQFPQNGDDVMDDRGANLKSKTRTLSLFGADTFSVTDNTFLNISGRYNHTDVNSRDQDVHHYWNSYTGQYGSGIRNTLTSTENPNASLSGDHVFHRFNPSVGLTFKPIEGVVTYGNYNEGSRAPTAVELGCANPDAPCNLPNSMAGDPPLKQVVSKTFEVGVRGKTSQNVNYNAAAYNTRLEDDIMFVNANASAKGYFKNFGETQRRGFEMGLSKTFDNLTLAANYSFIDATYQSNETFNSASNTSGTTVYSPVWPGANCNPATGGVLSGYSRIVGSSSTDATTGLRCDSTRSINVTKGKEIPGIPNNILKIYANYRVNDKLNISANTLTVGSVYAKGAENNAGAGSSLSGYTLLNLAANYEAMPNLSIFGKINNVFDKEYYTGGVLGANVFDANHTPKIGNTATSDGVTSNYGASSIETFGYAGAPRAAWIGIRYEFGGAKKSAE